MYAKQLFMLGRQIEDEKERRNQTSNMYRGEEEAGQDDKWLRAESCGR
jgi:hypothetical protein